jgi:hypothetical protein
MNDTFFHVRRNKIQEHSIIIKYRLQIIISYNKHRDAVNSVIDV